MQEKIVRDEPKSFKRIFFIRTTIFLCNALLLVGLLHIPAWYRLYFPTKELNLHIFADVITPEVFYEFEKQTGIKVNVNYFVSDEELLAKLRIDRGEGSDLITISDRNAEIMMHEKILQKIDWNKINHSSGIDKRLTALFSDETLEYALPFSWTPIGIGYNKKFFGGALPFNSWRMIFRSPQEALHQEENSVATGELYEVYRKAGAYHKTKFDWMNQQKPYKICMFDDKLDCYLLAGIYLFGTTENLFTQEQSLIKDLLMQQKKWVEIYTNANTEYYLRADIVPLLVTNSALMKGLVTNNQNFGFSIPEEGSLITVLNFAIPVTSKKYELVHKLIDFLWSKRVALENFKAYGYNPANTLAYSEIDDCFFKNPSFFPTEQVFKRLYVAHNQAITVKELAKMWLAIKSM